MTQWRVAGKIFQSRGVPVGAKRTGPPPTCLRHHLLLLPLQAPHPRKNKPQTAPSKTRRDLSGIASSKTHYLKNLLHV